VDPQQVHDACDERTRIVSISWIGYASGWRIDVAEFARIAHDRGALLMLDAIQGLGLFPIDVRKTGVDFLAADGHKWLLGPEGAGICFIRQELLGLLRPLGVGWHSSTAPFDYARASFELRSAASRYEGGSHNMSGFLGLGASVDLLMSMGLNCHESPIARDAIDVTDRACERLIDAGATILGPRVEGHKSSIATFEIPGVDSNQFRQHCLRSGIALSCRGGGIRISPHGYTNDEDVDRLIAAVKGFRT
jgi:selenocysteine lyase/cysteine desulfurase